MSATRYRLFCAVAPGLEPLLEEELRRLDATYHLGLSGLTQRAGGVDAQGNREGLWQIACRSRLTESLRVRIGRFEARRFDQLEAGLARLPWHAYLPPGPVPAVHAVCHKSAMYHSGAVAERVAGVIGTAQAKRRGVPDDRPPPAVHVRIERDVVQVSVDASGELLHRRGWRTRVGPAPLRETLAAACVQAAGIGAAQVVWDPFCGAGTVAIEAVLAGQATWSPGRRYAFESWPTHDATAWQAQLATLTPRPPPTLRAIGSDLDPAALTAARANAADAGVSDRLTLAEGDFETVVEQVPQGAAVLCNPPYGKRMGRHDLGDLLTRLGHMLGRRRDLRPVAVLSGAPGFGRGTGLRWETRLRLNNRGLRVRLFVLG